MFLLPILFHSHLGLPITIALVIVLAAVRIVIRQRRRARGNPTTGQARHATTRPQPDIGD